jgi:hypothetical protein
MTPSDHIPCVAMGAEAVDGMVRVRALTEDRRFPTWDIAPTEARRLARTVLEQGPDWGFHAEKEHLFFHGAPTHEAGEAFALALLKALAEARAEAAR